ncbi:hypothetical protein B0H12DRAFT_225203 [Mycena haematopus]|nr:hypothetical protein B0H12DRAFT_225203 [Mycena haematopus]
MCALALSSCWTGTRFVARETRSLRYERATAEFFRLVFVFLVDAGFSWPCVSCFLPSFLFWVTGSPPRFSALHIFFVFVFLLGAGFSWPRVSCFFPSSGCGCGCGSGCSVPFQKW